MLYALAMLITVISAWKPRSDEAIEAMSKTQLKKSIRRDFDKTMEYAAKMRGMRDICDWPDELVENKWEANPEDKLDLLNPPEDVLSIKLGKMSMSNLQDANKAQQFFLLQQKLKYKRQRKRCNVICPGFNGFDDDTQCNCTFDMCKEKDMPNMECGCSKAKQCCMIIGGFTAD